jgi:proteasome assembly chaperone (PAC2) family protein
MCTWCLRVSSVIGWIDVEQAAQVLQVFQEAMPLTIDYTICDEDREQLEKVIRERLE